MLGLVFSHLWPCALPGFALVAQDANKKDIIYIVPAILVACLCNSTPIVPYAIACILLITSTVLLKLRFSIGFLPTVAPHKKEVDVEKAQSQDGAETVNVLM